MNPSESGLISTKTKSAKFETWKKFTQSETGTMKLALGTAQFGMSYGIANQRGQVHKNEVSSILEMAAASGIDMLDTAIAYGESETVLGAAGCTSFKIVSKLPQLPTGVDSVGGWALEQVLSSLKRLNAPALYGLLLHHPQELMGSDGSELVASLQSMKQEGLINKIGVSIYSPSELEQLRGLLEFDLVQAPFNVVDRRLSDSGWLEELHKTGVEVHTRSPFLQGLLLMPREQIPSKFSSWMAIWDAWHSWLESSQIGAVKACLDFINEFAYIDRIVVGVDSVEQFQQVLRASDASQKLSPPDVSSADELLVDPSKWNLL